MKTIRKIKSVGRKPVYDLSVKDAEHYVLENGVITHNTGVMYSSDAVWIIGRSKEKEGSDLAGYKFTINIEKSRFVREKSKFPFIVKFKGGIDRWSGLMDIALETGHVIKPKNGWYTRVIADPKTGEVKDDKNWRMADTSCQEFWAPLLTDTDYCDRVRERYALGVGAIFADEEEEPDVQLLEG